MRQIVLDAGPLIGLFHPDDTHHDVCEEGFAYLSQNHVVVIVPIPIVFEVYKWLLNKTYPEFSQQALRTMERNFYILPPEKENFAAVQRTIYELPKWKGSLEDATVVLTTLRFRCPVWTYNFRDFSAFQLLEFWNP